MKKILSVIVLASALILTAGVALAATTPTQAPVKYTADQRACINSARKTQQVAMKAAQDTLNAETKDALATKQAATKAAQDAFDAATKDALATKQAAMKAVQAIKDPKSRMAAIKAANDVFNNDSKVKEAKPALQAAMKAANNAYNNDPSVKQAMPAYTSAIKAARTNIIKKCTGASGISGATGSVLQSIGELFRKATSSLLNAFHF